MSPGPKPRNCSAAGAVFERFLTILKVALPGIILYKRGLIGILSLRRGALAARFGTMPTDNTPRGHRYGRSQKKNIAIAAWHAPLGGCAEEADLCRGQGFRRIAPPAPPRPQDRHVQGPAGSEGQKGIVMAEGRREKVCRPLN